MAKLVYDMRRANTKSVHDVDNMEKILAGKSFEDLDKVKHRYGKLIKNLDRYRKNGFKDFKLAWNGCLNKTCTGAYIRNWPTHHPICFK